MEMHCELLASKFPEEGTTAGMVDLIKGMAGGKATHRAGALKLALRNKRPKKGVPMRCTRPEKGVLLRCTRSDCVYFSDPISSQRIGTGLFCPGPHNRLAVMRCTGCGEGRTKNLLECRGCGERFT